MHASRCIASALCAAALALAVLPASARADKTATPPTRVSVDIGASSYLTMGDRITRVSVGTAEIADVAAFPPDQILVTGKRVGLTSATIWYGGDNVEVVMVEVTYPLEAMRLALRKAIKGGKKIDIRQAGASLVLSGQVAGADDVERAEEIARGFATVNGVNPTIINALSVPGSQQVQIEVAFAEVSRQSLRQIGVNFWARKGEMAGGLLAPTNTLRNVSPELADSPNVSQLNFAGDDNVPVPLMGAPLTSAFGAIFSSAVGDFPFSAALSLLARKGYARVLAEPTLVALSGKSASFLAGGEFPIPLPQSLGQIAVEFKKFGIQINFTPTVVGETIQLELSMTVSDVDENLGIKLASVTVPGLSSRHAQSTIRLKDGQSFAIAGLLSDSVRSNVDKLPGLGNLPVLGALFRSTSYRREETELLVVVTARKVKPLGERPELPGERTKADPSDIEFLLLGRTESIESYDDEPRSTARTGAAKEAKRWSTAPAGLVGFKR